ncbi:ribosome-associated translation inhibitor RaiA [Patescibacteria group bacterium]|jgi:putative sigma-54 modulation protein|nr:ribosome-associated translation inhibitor RaiA [Patescibacteria group bacterium]
MTINIHARGIELTPAIKQYTEEKMQSVEKYLESIQHMDVEVGRADGHKHKGDVYECKVVVQIGGEVMKIERDAEDLYKAIDKVRDHLRVELSDWKKRMDERSKAGSGEE